MWRGSPTPSPDSPHRDHEKHNSAFRHGPRSPRAWLSARRVHKGVTRGSAHGSAVTILKFLILFGEEPALASEGSFVPVSLPPRAPSAAWRVPGPPLGAHHLAPPPPALGLPLSLCGCLCRSRLPRRPGTLPRSTAPPSFLAPLPGPPWWPSRAPPSLGLGFQRPPPRSLPIQPSGRRECSPSNIVLPGPWVLLGPLVRADGPQRRRDASEPRVPGRTGRVSACSIGNVILFLYLLKPPLEFYFLCRIFS